MSEHIKIVRSILLVICAIQLAPGFNLNSQGWGKNVALAVDTKTLSLSRSSEHLEDTLRRTFGHQLSGGKYASASQGYLRRFSSSSLEELRNGTRKNKEESNEDYNDTQQETDDSLDFNFSSQLNLNSPDDYEEAKKEPQVDGSKSVCGLPLYRLPERIVPVHYDLVMMPDLDELTFEGAVQIELRVEEAKERARARKKGEPQVEEDLIVLHADDSLKIDNVWYLDLSGSAANSSSKANAGEQYIDVLDVCRDPDYQLLIVRLAKRLLPGQRGQLYFTFAGALSSDPRGFYMSGYNAANASEEMRFHAVTQFQSTDARRAFPCFDEPQFKATFELTLIHAADRLSLANTEVVFEQPINKRKSESESSDEDKENNGSGSGSSSSNNNNLRTTLNQKEDQKWKLVRFAKTPPMSTYLLAFVVGEFDHLERVQELSAGRRKLRIRVYTPLGKRDEGRFALDTACKAIVALEDYFQLEFPLSKIDLIGIPDFEAGAMENWGLITFREAQFLLDAHTSLDTKSLIASTVVHELAHQWFGNLVTMKWWNDLWLNEGFATWMEYKLTDELYPELEFNYRYSMDSHIQALNEDSLRTAHPIQPQLVESPAEIEELFDPISYNKAAAIIGILHDEYLGADKFRAAIKRYMRMNAYKNTEALDLWLAMEAESELPVRRFMQNWITQAGHPLIKIELAKRRNESNRTARSLRRSSLQTGPSSEGSGEPNGVELLIEQQRFLTGVDRLTKAEREQSWIVPISILVSDGKSSAVHLNLTLNFEPENGQVVKRVALPDWFELAPNSSSWLKMNVNFSGFYRVKYEEKLFDQLKRPIEAKELQPIDRLNLLDEAHALHLANKFGSAKLLALLSWFASETNGAVLDSLVGAYNSLFNLYEHQGKLFTHLKLFGQKLFGPIYRSLGGFKGSVLVSGELSSSSIGHIEALGLAAILNVLVKLNYEPAIQDALHLFNQSTANQPLEAHLRGAVYAAVAKRGSEAQFQRLIALLQSADSREERQRLMGALVKATSESRLEAAWSLLRQPKVVLDDKLNVLSWMLANPTGREFVRKLVSDHPAQLVELNRGKPVTNFIEELCLSLGAKEINEMDRLLIARPELVADNWESSLDYIKRTQIWQRKIHKNYLKSLDLELNRLLATMGSEMSESRKISSGKAAAAAA